MVSAKLLLMASILITFLRSANTQMLDYIYPGFMTMYYSQVPTKEGYRSKQEEPNGNIREEIGVIMNPGTADEELVIVGMYTAYDEKSDTETMTMYTADKNGYKSRYKVMKCRNTGPMMKKCGLSAKVLKSLAKGSK
ncbi:PREDICTED: uncharacterized protein LOC108978168 [Bactrocera latifrons]|uniref:uncharacterized protein LOC108978168 n=1 Tax=Bactrocera latifrons TaxID=174628 RepID=UPI0008DE95EA|nr:PREDICTED: uncharacterized protein LOC108978168 [Bactrocera latifrons]